MGPTGANTEGLAVPVSEWQWAVADFPPPAIQEIFLSHQRTKLLARQESFASFNILIFFFCNLWNNFICKRQG
jgi:hypothetical protein